ncbi:MAG: GIY-YIG nuclease family protein [Patescibacteria group bacterium]
MSEIIYVLTNEAMPGYVKIGKTNNNLEQRVKDLSASTSVPLPFTVFYACSVKDANFVEHQLHDAFDNNRVNPRREFFQIAPERVVAALKLAELENITPNQDLIETNEDREAHNEALDRRGRFNFEIVKIPLGAEIYFSRDESKKAKVVDLHSSKSIEFNDQITSLSDSARILLGVNYGVAGTDYWMFEGETLDERRRRVESGE